MNDLTRELPISVIRYANTYKIMSGQTILYTTKTIEQAIVIQSALIFGHNESCRLRPKRNDRKAVFG